MTKLLRDKKYTAFAKLFLVGLLGINKNRIDLVWMRR